MGSHQRGCDKSYGKSLLYLFLKFVWYFMMSLIARTYKQTFWFVFLVVCAMILFVGDTIISKHFKSRGEKNNEKNYPKNS